MPAGKQYARILENAQLPQVEISTVRRMLTLVLQEHPQPVIKLAELFLLCGANPTMLTVLTKLILDEDR